MKFQEQKTISKFCGRYPKSTTGKHSEKFIIFNYYSLIQNSDIDALDGCDAWCQFVFGSNKITKVPTLPKEQKYWNIKNIFHWMMVMVLVKCIRFINVWTIKCSEKSSRRFNILHFIALRRILTTIYHDCNKLKRMKCSNCWI